MSIVKSKILKQLADNYPKFLKKDIELALDSVLNEIIKALANNQNCEIRGFGTLKIKKLKERVGRNPKTGLKITIPSRNTIQWKMSKQLFNILNKKYE